MKAISQKWLLLSGKVIDTSFSNSGSTLRRTGKFKGVEKMITSRIALAEVDEKGFKELIEHRDDHIKILVTPKAGNLE
jgi:hypothetical protein